MYMAATAITSVAKGLLNRGAEAKAARRERDSRVLEATARSKAEGTEAVMSNVRAAEENQATLRQSLRLQGAYSASADSAGIAGTSINEGAKDIEMQGVNAMALAKYDADAKIAVTKMASKARYDSILYSTKTFKPASLGGILAGAALETGVSYLSAQAMGSVGGKAGGT